jgi:hypothetical protein
MSEYGRAHGHVAHYVFLYEHGHVSVFRVRDPRTFTKFTTFTHRNSLLPLAKRRIQIDIKASTVVPDKSTSLARRMWPPRADESGLVHGAMIESCQFISQINLILWNTCSCPCPLWDLSIAKRIRIRTSWILRIALRTRIRTFRFFNVTDTDTLQIPCFAYRHYTCPCWALTSYELSSLCHSLYSPFFVVQN